MNLFVCPRPVPRPACSVRPRIPNNGPVLLSHPGVQGPEERKPLGPTPAPLEMGQAELFTPRTDTREKGHKGVCRGWGAAICTLLPPSPS